MIAYRDGKQITICDGCFKEGPSVVECDSRGRELHFHAATCFLPDEEQRFRCPDCVTTGEPVCTHESRP